MRQWKVVNVPSLPFSQLGNIPKGDLGEKFVEFCLKSLFFEENKDFRMYQPSGPSYGGGNYPDLSDDTAGRRKTFEIEVKNLSLGTPVTRAWCNQQVISRFSKGNHAKICIIFGGRFDPSFDVISNYLESNGIRFIHYPNPVEAKDYFDLSWRLKDDLLEVTPIRRRAIVAISRIWNPKQKPQPVKIPGYGKITSGGILLPILAFWGDQPFVTLSIDTHYQSLVLTSLPSNKQWREEWGDIHPFFAEDKTAWIDWSSTKSNLCVPLGGIGILKLP